MRVLVVRTIVSLCVVTACFAIPAAAAVQVKDGVVDVSGLVPGPPPATPPTIDIPAQNKTFAVKMIDVKGSCIPGLVVKIFRSAVFAGSAYCQPDAIYNLQIDLMEGRNDLIARQYDALNQSSPDSDTVTVFYVPPAQQPDVPETPSAPPSSTTPPAASEPSPRPTAPGGTAIAQFQLIIDYDYHFTNIAVNKPFHLPVHFLGGTEPYAVSIMWGDGNQSVISRENTEQFFADHTYTKAGMYTVKLRVSDKKGNEASLQFALLVNGQVVANATSTSLRVPAGWIEWLSAALFMLLGAVLASVLFVLVKKRRKRSKS